MNSRPQQLVDPRDFQWVINLLCLVALFAPMTAIGDEKDYESTAKSAGGSWRGSPDEWTGTERYKGLADYAERPEDDVLDTITVDWEPLELDALGNLCTIRGQLRVPNGDSEETHAIDWFQGVTVYMAQQPGATPDWSAGMNQNDTLSETAVVSPSGKFVLNLDVRESGYDRTGPQDFQFGLALAHHTKLINDQQGLIWSSREPAIEDSIQMLGVPAAPEFSHELQLINRANRWPNDDPNGVHLICALNALQPLGKDKALEVLEEYVRFTDTDDYFSEPEIVFWIIRVLFKPSRLEERIPPPAIAVYLMRGDSPEATKWPIRPMALINDIPFMLGRQIGMGGMPEHPSSHIRWARENGIIRGQPLHPNLGPVMAAESLFECDRFMQLDESTQAEAIARVRHQAVAMSGGALEYVGWFSHSAQERQQQIWDRYVEKAKRLSMIWNTDRQEFVIPQE